MFFKKLKYRLDNLMSRGTVVMVVLLFGLTAFVVMLAGFLAMILDSTEHSYSHSAWKNFMYTLDPGNLSGAEGNAAYLFIALIVTLCGLFFTSILIGIITSGIEKKMTDLRRGRSIVYEQNHIILLGFNETAILILKQLVLAGENVKRQVIVVMDDMNKDEMQDEIRQHIPDSKTTRIVCRSGKPDNIYDLQMCSPEKCHSIIIANKDDYYSLKSVLALIKMLGKAENRKVHITTTVNDLANLEAFRIAGGEQIETIVMQNTIARIIAHSCLQPGISAVYTELFNFEGVEIYIEAIEGAEGLRFDEASLRFHQSTLIGLVRDGKPMLNPEKDILIQKDDLMVLIAQDDGMSKLSKAVETADESRFARSHSDIRLPKQMLVLGYNPLLLEILQEEDKYLPKGSKVTVMIESNLTSSTQELQNLSFVNIKLDVRRDCVHNRSCLEKILHDGLDNVLVLSNMTVDKNQSDNESMLTLLLLRDLAREKNLGFSITTEIQNSENQQLIALETSTDFVVSSFITAMIASQVSQTRALAVIFADLLDESGSEIYLKPVSKYINTSGPIDFLTATAAVTQQNEVLIGYRKQIADNQYETRLNPGKNERITFADSDSFIVISENG